VDRSSVLHAPRFRPDPAIAAGGRFGFKELIGATTSSALTTSRRTTTPIDRNR
jgi:hypothetical protein